MSKRIVAVILCVILVFSVFCISAYAETENMGEKANGKVAIIGNEVNFRSGPGTGYSSAGFLYRGDKGRLTNIYPDKDHWNWFRMQITDGHHYGEYGWVFHQYADVTDVIFAT